MGFKEIASLDADVTIALGKKDKETGKPYPKEIEGYYLGSRTVKSKRGESALHFLQTGGGNVGVWGTTDLNRKLGGVAPGTMVRVTSTGTKPTPNGDMYTYRVEQDSDNTIDVAALEASYSRGASADEDEDNDEGNLEEDEGNSTTGASLVASLKEANQAKLQDILTRKSKTK